MKIKSIFLNKNLKIFILFIVTLFLLILTKNVYADSNDYNIESYTINANLQDNGNMHVEELIKYKFNNYVNGVYRDILYKYTFNGQKDNLEPTSSRYQASNVNGVFVYVSDTGFDNMQPYGIQDESMLKDGDSNQYSLQNILRDGYRKYVKVYMPTNEEEYRYVKYIYDIYDVGVKYNDASEIYWNFVGKDWDDVLNNLTINFYWGQNLNKSDVYVYPHSYADINNLNIYDDHVTLSYNSVSSNTAVDARVVMPSDVLKSATKTITENYNYQQLDNIEKQIQKQKENRTKSLVIQGFSIIYIIIFSICLVVASIKVRLKNKKSIKKVDYYTDLPEGFNLDEVKVIVDTSIGIYDPKLFLSTVLDLINNKYLILDEQKKVKTVFNSSDYDYYIKLNTDKTFSNLSDYELEIISILFNTNKTTIKYKDLSKITNEQIELNERIKELSAEGKSDYRIYLSDRKKEYQEKFYQKNFSKLLKTLVFGSIIYLIITLVNMFIIDPTDNISSTYMIVMGLVFLYVFVFDLAFVLSAYNLKQEYADAYNKFIGLKKYLKDYSLIKDRYPIEIVLWEKYMVYATLFGEAKKVLKEFKEELITKGYNEDTIYTSYPTFCIASFSDNIVNSIASSTGTSSSGGYSSGGGGRRRRGRLFLKI